jgi:hypothetical protein
MFAITKAVDLNWLVQGGQQYWAFPFSKGSLIECTFYRVCLICKLRSSKDNQLVAQPSVRQNRLDSCDGARTDN